MNSAILSLALATILAPAVEKSSTATTRVYVQTDPSGAVVKLDGKPVGKSDDLFVVPPGVRKMTVEVELDDHYPARQEVEVHGGRITRVKLNLDRRKGAEGEKPTTVVPKEADKREVATIVEKTVKTVSTMAEGDPNMAKVLANLKGLDEAAAVKEVAKFLDSKMETIRRAAIYVLWRGAFRSIEPAVPALLRLCEHEEDMTRGMAAIALGGNRVARSLPSLIKMTTEDPSGYARRCAAYALGLLGDKEAVPTLKKALKDADPLVRNNAQAALTMLDAHQEEGQQKQAQPPAGDIGDFWSSSCTWAGQQKQAQPPAGDSSDKQPSPARLDFRIAPVHDGKPELSEAEIKRYADDLQAHGPEAGRKADQSYAWFETRPTNPQILITAIYQDRTYALLSNKPDEVMLARGDRKGVWGLKRVAAEKDEKGHLAILVELDGAGGGRLRELSKANIHRLLAILINDVVVFAPELQSTISDKAEISGRFTEEEEKKLVAELQAGLSSRDGERPVPTPPTIAPPEAKDDQGRSKEATVQVFAAEDGIVGEVRITDGQRVAKGDVLVVLRNNKFDAQLKSLVGERQTLQQYLNDLGRLLMDDSRTTTAQRQRIAEEREAKLETVKAKIELLEKRRDALTVRSPVSGQVHAPNVRDLLVRPVQRGQLLMSIDPVQTDK